jgi:transcriptional regulator with XRE-family HTH domain
MAQQKITKDKVSKAFGERVRTLRVERTGLSQEEFADRVGVHRTFIGRVERGETNLTLANILRICTALGVTLSEFFRDFENNTSQ